MGGPTLVPAPLVCQMAAVQSVPAAWVTVVLNVAASQVMENRLSARARINGPNGRQGHDLGRLGHGLVGKVLTRPRTLPRWRSGFRRLGNRGGFMRQV